MSDQEIKDEIAKIKFKRELLKRLSELLQERPDLRSKMLTRLNPTGGGIFREVLSKLRNRQLLLVDINKELAVEEFPMQKLSDILKERLMEFSNQTTNAMGNAQIWIPQKASVEQCQKLTKAFSDLSNIATSLAETPTEKISELKSYFIKLNHAHQRAEAILADVDIKRLDGEYVDIRISDLTAMDLSIKFNRYLLDCLDKKDCQAFVMQLQKEINSETANTVLRLSSELARLSGVSVKIDETINKLSQIMEKDLLETQKNILTHNLAPWAKNAIPHQEKAAELIEKGVKLLDMAIVEFVKEKNKEPDPEEPPAPAKTLNEEDMLQALQDTLARLEKEARQPREAKMELGIKPTFNLKVKTDWEKATKKEKKEKKEIEKKRREMQQAKKEQQQQAKNAQRNAAKAQQKANKNRNAMSEALYKKIAVPWKNRGTKLFEGGESWNKLSSELRQSLSQDVDSDIPEAYREAIEQYFREIAEENNNNEKNK